MALKDTRMLAKALEQRWPIHSEYREHIVRHLMMIVLSDDSSPREKTSAARALLSADKLNMVEEQLAVLDENERRARLVELAKHITIGDAAKLASNHGIVIGRAEQASGVDATQAGEGTRPSNSYPAERG